MTIEKLHRGQVVLGTVAAAVLGSAGNALVSWVARSLGSDPQVIQGLQPKGYVVLTTLGVIVGAVVWARIRRRSERPRAVLRKLVPTVVGVSFLADVPVFFLDGADVLGVFALMVMHVVVAVIAVPIFRRVMPLTEDRTSPTDEVHAPLGA
ncbi:DUF6069 family protein [Streptomyces sp. DT2A-34]|uniref:DUF6069 family protein n=1 Tax=Streptomyces sp. DT2A-34 TaxID=3051182 RepID=UPI00265BFB7E|nr:DUF6069 family protein [Streptomyces sp. DT2A-34]MDO0909725.1 DUF6069 family protein [Streptomyces sp. DT2A-34]